MMMIDLFTWKCSGIQMQEQQQTNKSKRNKHSHMITMERAHSEKCPFVHDGKICRFVFQLIPPTLAVKERIAAL